MIVRKRLEIEAGGVVFITTTVRDWYPIFRNEEAAHIALCQFGETMGYFGASTIAYVLMPSHFHAVINLRSINDLSNLLRSFKGISSRKIKQLNYGIFEKTFYIDGKFHLWKPRFDDFVIRNMEQLAIKVRYIHENPVRAGLVSEVTDWKYSSARSWILDEPGLVEIDKNCLS